MSSSPWKASRALLSGSPRAKPISERQPRAEAAAAGQPGLNSPVELTVYSQEPGYVVAVAGRCLIQVCIDRTTSTTISLVRRALGDLADQYDTFGFLSLVEASAPVDLPPDLREGASACLRRYSDRFSGVAVVFEAQGFQATVVRSVVTAINLASRASHATKVVDDLRKGCNWLSGLTPGGPTAPRLFELTNQLRKRG